MHLWRALDRKEADYVRGLELSVSYSRHETESILFVKSSLDIMLEPSDFLRVDRLDSLPARLGELA